jgi:hypothetical protein
MSMTAARTSTAATYQADEACRRVLAFIDDARIVSGSRNVRASAEAAATGRGIEGFLVGCAVTSRWKSDEWLTACEQLEDLESSRDRELD